MVYTMPVVYNNPNTFAGLVGKVRKKLSPEGVKEVQGGEKSARSAPAGPRARPGPAAC